MGQSSVVPAPHACRDPRDLIPALGMVHDLAATGGGPAGRALISESWRRSREAGVDSGIAAAPLVFDRDVIDDARAAHPLHRHLPMLRGLLRQVADETAQLMVITDGAGHALWSEGPPQVRRQADAVGLVEGFCWSEGSMGTNGIGTALASGSAEYVYSAEHLAKVLHCWSCVGAPITDPDSGELIGCIDLSATAEALHPATVALVAAAAELTEARLALEMQAHDELLRDRYLRHLQGLHGEPGALVTATGRILAAEPVAWRGRRVAAPLTGGHVALPDGRLAVAEALGQAFLLRVPGQPLSRAVRPLLTLTLLGAGHPHARLDGRLLTLSLRHAEILAVLALHPQGLNADQLSLHLYGDEGNPVTIRGEIHRLRAQLGDLLRAKPYRLDCDIDADFLTVRRLLTAGDSASLHQAARLYRGDLLPRSDSPAVRAERDELAARLRRQLLDRGAADALWAYAQTEAGQDDLEMLERLAAIVPASDPRRAAAQSRLNRMLLEGL